MPPRFAYWTIIAGGLPTAFRTTEREELLPTFRRIKQKHPDVEMKYFARGRLWRSPDEARAEAEARRTAAAQRQSTRGGPPRGRDWRPGGEHRDPRQKFKDAKKERNQEWRKNRFDRRRKSAVAERKPEEGGKPETRGDRPWRDRPPTDDRGGEPYRNGPKTGDVRRPAPPRPSRPKAPYGSAKASGFRKPAPRPRPPGPGSRPAGPPDRGRNRRGPTKDRRRRS